MSLYQTDTRPPADWEARRDATRDEGRFTARVPQRHEQAVAGALQPNDCRAAIAFIEASDKTYDLIEVRPDDTFNAEQLALYLSGDEAALMVSVRLRYAVQSREWAEDAAREECESVDLDFIFLDDDEQEQIIAAIWAKDVSDPIPQLLNNTRRRD
jgi:hypothetical protein